MGKGQVKKRKVFYIPGYDPIPPRRYRELYRKEGADQAAISGYEISLRPGSGKSHYGWDVEGNIDGRKTQADFEVLVWSDIVRGSMETGIVGTYLQLIRTAWTYIASGALARLMRLRKGPVIAALYPIVFLIIQLILAVIIGWVGAKAVGWGLDRWFAISGPIAWGGQIILALGLVVGILSWFKSVDNRFFAYYLMHDYAYSAQSKGANPSDLEGRIQEFRHVISSALHEDFDEVLVVGHSSGAHLGVSILSDLIRAGEVPPDGPNFGFLSLGHVVPMVSFLPKADRLRGDLHFLSQTDALTWVDVTAPGDGCAFALCDPVSVTGVAPKEKKWPLVISAAFKQTLSPETWAKLKRRYFRLHFQYLCAFDRPGDYDYFQITAGPSTLAERFKGRSPSPSRLTTPASKYRSMK